MLLLELEGSKTLLVLACPGLTRDKQGQRSYGVGGGGIRGSYLS
jgi:hypothetical protein